MAMRKFLVGQTAQLVFQSHAMKRMNLSTKKVFDDIYLHLETQARNRCNVSEEAQDQYRLIEREHNEKHALRSILFKTKDYNHMEMSLQASLEYSNYNTCDDYLQSARANTSKYQPDRQALES